MESIYRRVESWIKDQTARMAVSWPLQATPGWRWPPWKDRQDRREQELRLREEYERQRRQLRDLCHAAKADSIDDLQEILCSMVLAECVYKRPAAEMIRAINKFKGDFGGHLVSLERVQPSLDHVLHRYLLAEAGDTLFASFIGTKQYKDVITDVNIFQGAVFHDDDDDDFEAIDVIESDIVDGQKKIEETLGKPTKETKKMSKFAKPAAHRGFLARANGIPALEIYKLAQKKNRKLVLCGHSLGGAVAALATLAILRVLSSSSICKEHAKIQVKCITFSQPPVGNAALKDYVHQKGWQNYFKSYCIPEDLVPRILSPAYFHHYNSQSVQETYDSTVDDSLLVKSNCNTKKSQVIKPKDACEEQLVLGLGPVQTSFWRLSKLVPLEGMRRHLNILRSVGNKVGRSSLSDQSPTSLDETEAEPQSLEIQEGCDGISLKPISDTERLPPEGNSKSHGGTVDSRRWHRVSYLPSYVPFGQLYLLRDSLVELLSDAEYSKLTSMSSVIAELKERLQSHSMRSYRSRFQKIYEQIMCINAASFLGMDQLPVSPHLKQLLGLKAVGSVELGHIVNSPIIRTATSILPLGWSGIPGNKNGEPLKVDIIGHGLHLCALVQARVNGSWCSTVVESLPSVPSYTSNLSTQPDLQKMRIVVGAPLKKPPKCPVEESLSPLFSYPVAECINTSADNNFESCDQSSISEAIGDFVVYCTTDFTTVLKKVHVRVRRVRLLGFEGAGKTSLFKAVVDRSRKRKDASFESVHAENDFKEKIIDGLCYLDSEGVNLQELHSEAAKLREELQNDQHDLRKKIDLIVLVHNLSQRIPHCHQSVNSSAIPALSVLLREVKDHEVPWVLAITNKFSVSAHEQSMLVKSAMEAYEAHPTMTQVINSCPFVVPSLSSSFESLNSTDSSLTKRLGHQKLILAPINLARMSFQRKEIVFPIEGVTAFRQLVHRVLHSHEEMAFQELANERLSHELAREKEMAMEARQVSRDKGNLITAAAVGGSLGAGLGLVMAVVMGAASALRKP